jgi:hypothetical protein
MIDNVTNMYHVSFLHVVVSTKREGDEKRTVALLPAFVPG